MQQTPTSKTQLEKRKLLTKPGEAFVIQVSLISQSERWQNSLLQGWLLWMVIGMHRRDLEFHSNVKILERELNLCG